MASEERKQQFRDAQRRRREKLAAGNQRSQVNIFLTQKSKQLLDQWCDDYNTDRHDLINGMILTFSKTTEQIPGILTSQKS